MMYSFSIRLLPYTELKSSLNRYLYSLTPRLDFLLASPHSLAKWSALSDSLKSLASLTNFWATSFCWLTSLRLSLFWLVVSLEASRSNWLWLYFWRLRSTLLCSEGCFSWDGCCSMLRRLFRAGAGCLSFDFGIDFAWSSTYVTLGAGDWPYLQWCSLGNKVIWLLLLRRLLILTSPWALLYSAWST